MIARAGLVALSDALHERDREEIETVKHILSSFCCTLVEGEHLYAPDGEIRSGSAEERAEDLNRFFRDPEIEMVFDVSGGNIANEVLPYIDYEAARKSEAVFAGYSDLTTVINALYEKSGKTSWLWQIRNLVRDTTGLQVKRFANWYYGISDDLFQPEFEAINGGKAEGVLIGGNIRCFLKLSGTPYMPNLDDRILFLEARSGRTGEIITYFSELRDQGAFMKAKAVILGTFTEMEREAIEPGVIEILSSIAEVPVLWHTKDVGHSELSKALLIGDSISLS